MKDTNKKYKPRRRPSREEYAEKFKKQLEKAEYELKPGEKIIQCRNPYPDYWFISDQGYIFTAFYNDLRILNDNPTVQGPKNKDGERDSVRWKYFYGDSQVTAWRLMAEYFLECNFDTEENIVVHHIKPRSSFDKSQGAECNRADNLQMLPDKVHRDLTTYNNPNYEKNHAAKIRKEMQKNNVSMTIQPINLTKFTEALLQSIDFEDCEIYLKNLETGESAAFHVADHKAGDQLPTELNFEKIQEQ